MGLSIALLTDGIFPFVIGGMQKHSYYLAKYLVLNGIKIDLFHCVNHENKIPSEEEVFSALFGEENEATKTAAKQHFKQTCIHFPKNGKLPGHYIRNSYRYSELLFNEIKPSLNDYHFIYAKGFCACKLLKEKRKGLICAPVGVKFHGLNMFQKAASFKSKLEHLMFRPAVKLNMHYADYVFSYGSKITNLHLSIGVLREKVIELATGIEKNWISQKFENHTPIRFLFIGRYERLKGIEELNQAIEILLKKNKPFEFHFIGPISKKHQLKSKNITYHGVIMDKTRLSEKIKQCDVLVCPSYSEGMPNVIMEAMAMGLTVIATDVGATNLLVNNENGWLISSPKITEIVSAMEQAINLLPHEISVKKKKSTEHISENFTWDKIALQTIEEIKKRSSLFRDNR